MSLVLEALRRQEAGSDPDAIVSLARQASQRRRHRLWVGLFAAAMACNVAVLAWVFGRPLLAGPAAPPAQVSAVAPEPAAPEVAAAAGADRATMPPVPAGTPAPPPAAAGEAPPRSAPRSERESPAATAAAERLRPAPAPGRTRIALADLPADARARFPGIAFSSHIYTDDPALRAIIANGARLAQGDRVRGLEIVEITESGVVLAFEQYDVAVPLAADWET